MLIRHPPQYEYQDFSSRFANLLERAVSSDANNRSEGPQLIKKMLCRMSRLYER
jgi:hypothetical protein